MSAAAHGEHALVDAEQEGRDSGRADGGVSENALEAEVLEVADERRGAVREGERVAPEEPLERADGNTSHGQEDHGQGVFAAQ